MSARSFALKGLLIAGGMALCVGAGTWLSGASFMAMSERSVQRVPNVKLTSISRYWSEYGDDPKQAKRLKLSMGLSYGLTCLVLPFGFGMAALGRRRPLHGDARFANGAEIKSAKLLDGEGIIVGKYRGRYLTYPGQQYVWVAAPPRSGKGRGIAVPNLLNWSGSVMVLDFKNELWELTSGFRASCGHKMFRFAPFDKDGSSSRCNPLGYVRNDELNRVSDLLAIGNIVYPEPAGSGEGGSSKFFAESARNLFLGLGLYLLETPELPRTFGQMLRLASGNGKPFHVYLSDLIKKRIAEKRPLSRECVDALNRFLSNAAQVLSSILSTFTAPLTLFMDPVVDAATSGNDFDLSKVRNEHMGIYLCIPFENVPSSRLLVNLLFTQAININTREQPKPGMHQCLMLLDEFAVPGRIDVLTRSIGLMPSFDLRVLIMCQSESQVAFEYGKDTAKTIRTAMGMQVLFPPKEQEDAEAYSRMLDNQTELVRNRNSSSGRGGTSSGHSEQQQRRALMLPQEIKRLPNTKQIIVMEQCLPILCDRANYDADAELERRSKIRQAVIPPLDLETHVARIHLCVRPMEADEGTAAKPVPVERMAPNFKQMPPLRNGATDEEIDKWQDSFFDMVVSSAAAIAAAAEPPVQEAQAPKKTAAKKTAAKRKPAAKRAKKGAESAPEDQSPPEGDSEERWAAAYEQAEDDLDLSAAFKRRGAGDHAGL